jgi:hypothetical protein
MYKDMKLIKNFFRVFYAIPLGVTTWNLSKGVIAKMTYLAKFWLILESNLVESVPHGIFV